MIILACDPGPAQTGWCLYDDGTVLGCGVLPNDQLLYMLKLDTHGAELLACEAIASYGMSVGAEVFNTCIWIGRFIQAFPRRHRLVYRKEVKMHLCGSMKAKDGNIRQALIDKFGGKVAAIGCKANPGPLYGVKSHAWSALAVAVYSSETAV